MIDLGGGMIFPDAYALGPPDVPERDEDDETEQYLDFVEAIAPAAVNGTCPGVGAHKGRCYRIPHKPSGLCARCDLIRSVLKPDDGERRREGA